MSTTARALRHLRRFLVDLVTAGDVWFICGGLSIAVLLAWLL